MPELPEVETVRRGLDRLVTGRAVAGVEVYHPRAIRRHAAGSDDFVGLITGRTPLGVRRRGKYLWLPLDSGDAIVAHLGMSGQFLVGPPEASAQPHLRVRFTFADGGHDLRFVDQRTFGGLWVAVGGAALPDEIAHIAPDPFDPGLSTEQGRRALHAALRRRDTGLKRALLDQTVISGIGNIYADEALWRACLHYARRTATIRPAQTQRLLAGVRDVMADALAQGGTSFDKLYVDVDGRGGYFERSLAVYGRAGRPCLRCGASIRREAFMNRSSFFCPRCQPRPRHPHQ